MRTYLTLRGSACSAMQPGSRALEGADTSGCRAGLPEEQPRPIRGGRADSSRAGDEIADSAEGATSPSAKRGVGHLVFMAYNGESGQVIAGVEPLTVTVSIK